MIPFIKTAPLWKTAHIFTKNFVNRQIYFFYIINSKIKLVKPVSLSFFLTDNML